MRPDAIDWTTKQRQRHLSRRPAPRLPLVVCAWMIGASVVQAVAGAGASGLAPWLDARAPHGIADAVSHPAWSHALGLAAASVLVTPLAWIRIRRWAGTLSALQRAVQRLARGAAPFPVPVRGPAEVSYLAVGFNGMASQIAAHRRELELANKELEQRVRARTEQLRQAAEKLEALADSDTLTGLGNRRVLAGAVLRLFDRSVEDGTDLVCAAVDLDGFKGINDTLGHAAGDSVLRIAGDVLKEACRATDLAIRLGGDEFVLVLPMESPAGAEAIVQRIMDEFASRSGRYVAGAPVPRNPSMSIGIASRLSCGATSADSLLRAADEALYASKHSGRAKLTHWAGANGSRASKAA